MIRYNDNFSELYGITLVSDRIVRKTCVASTEDYYLFIKALCRHFMLRPDPMVVPIYDFQTISIEALPGHRYGTYKYSYDMKRLGLLDKDERALINQVAHENSYYGRPATCDNPRLAPYHKTHPRLLGFMEQVCQMKRYHDIHCGNFMKDEQEEIRIIDIEGFIDPPLDRVRHNWITR
jgi:hypothetical protein